MVESCETLAVRAPWFRFVRGGGLALLHVGLVLLCAACSETKYSVNVTVTGLSQAVSDGIELQFIDNDSHQEVAKLSIPADGEFKTEEVPENSVFAISVVKKSTYLDCKVDNEEKSYSLEQDLAVSIRCSSSSVFKFGDGHGAASVIGQQAFSERIYSDSPNRFVLGTPIGKPAFAGGRLYAPGSNHHRVLGFNAQAFSPDLEIEPAELVVGQSDFISSESGPAELNWPGGISSNGITLAVADTGNHRILLYDVLSSSQSMKPKVVVGQPSKDVTNPDCGWNSLNSPRDVSIGGGKMVVADTGNHRVLIWNSIPNQDYKAPDVIVGQNSADKCKANDSNGDGATDTGPSGFTLNAPSGVWTDGTRLLVADTGNNRVLLWTQLPSKLGNGREGPDAVIGQPEFTTSGEGITRDRMRGPYAVVAAGQKVFVADRDNNRILIWNSWPESGMPASVLLGRPNEADPSIPANPPSNATFNRPSGMLLVAPYLVVSDELNYRLLIFKSQE